MMASFLLKMCKHLKNSFSMTIRVETAEIVLNHKKLRDFLLFSYYIRFNHNIKTV